jgi:hypothetical protein
MTEAARISETSIDKYFTRQYIPEDNSELHTRRCENFKSHIWLYLFYMGVNMSYRSNKRINCMEEPCA